MKTLMTTAALVALLWAAPAFAEDATAPAATDQPAAAAPAPDATAPAAAETPAMPDANAPATAETPPDANAPATAETPAAPDAKATAAAPAAGEKFLAKQESAELMASKFIGVTVYGAGDENLGDVNDIILSKDGSVDAVIVGVGGFLGIGEKNVAVPFKEISASTDENGSVKFVLHASKEELDAAPSFMTLADQAAASAAPAPTEAPAPAPAQ